MHDLFIKFLEPTLCSGNTRPRKVIREVSTLKSSYVGAWIHILLSIFKNHTIVAAAYDQYTPYFETLQCRGNTLLAEKKSNIRDKTFQLHVVSIMVDSRVDNELLPISDLLAHPVQLTEPTRTFGFISCGTLQKQPFAFYELTDVFDNYIWIVIFVFLVTVVPNVFCVFEEANSGLFKEHFSCLEVLKPQNWFRTLTFFAPICDILEQGSVLTDKQMNVGSLRIIAGSVILVSVVLSNAYKNDNVYNMIKSRNSVPFWYLKQLEQEKFEILTRLDTLYRLHGSNAKHLQAYSLSVSSDVFSKHTFNFSVLNKWKGKFYSA